jgi:hypothetical protein
MKKSSLLICLFSVILVFAAMPAHGAWVSEILPVDNFTALAEDPGEATTWYAGTFSGEIHKYEDATGWQSSSTGLPGGVGVLSLAVDPSNASTVYAGLNAGGLSGVHGVYEWSDLDATWMPGGLAGRSVRDIAVDPYDTTIIFAATDDWVYRWDDVQGLWEQVTPPGIGSLNITKIALAPEDPPPSQTDVIYAAVAPDGAGNDGGIYKSIDGGWNWTNLNVAGSQSFNTIAVDPLDTSVLLAGSSDAGIFRSVDGGTSWGQVNEGLASLDVASIAFYPLNPGIVLAGTASGGVYRTDTAGYQWYAWNGGNPSLQANVVEYAVPQADAVFVGTGDGVVSLDLSNYGDFVITAISAPSSAYSNETVTMNATLATFGVGFPCCTGQWVRVHFYVSADQTIDSGDAGLGYIEFVGMNAGEVKTKSKNFVAPDSLPDGTYYILASLTTYNVYNMDTNNDLFVGPFPQMELTGPEFEVISLGAPASGYSNGTVTLNAELRNNGGGFTGYSSGDSPWVRVHYYLSGDNVLGNGDDTGLGHTEVRDIGQGATLQLSKVVTLPDWIEGKSADIPQMELIAPDFYIEWVTAPASGYTHGTVTLSAGLRNNGGGFQSPSSGSYLQRAKVHYYLSEDDVLDAGDLWLGTNQVSSMAIGGSVDVSLNVVLTTAAQNLFDSDPSNDVFDINNPAVTAADIPQMELIAPDFEIKRKNLIVPKNARAGDTITIKATLQTNGGGFQSPSSGSYLQRVHVKFYLSEDDILDTGAGGDDLLRTTSLSGMAPVSSVLLTEENIEIPSGAPSVGHKIFAVISTANLFESDTSNNVTFQNIRIR